MGTSVKSCPFGECAHYGKGSCRGIKKHGFDRKGRQRYQCNLTGRTYSEITGSPYCGHRKASEIIDAALALRARRKSIRKVARELGVNPKSVARWGKRFAA